MEFPSIDSFACKSVITVIASWHRAAGGGRGIIACWLRDAAGSPRTGGGGEEGIYGEGGSL